jgi:hypothetical protein
MQYRDYILTDLGFFDPETGEHRNSIEGLDNQTPGQLFRHAGIEGQPSNALRIIDIPGESPKTKCLGLIADDATPDAGGTEIAAADVPALLVAEYGWPEGTALGEDGMPVWPATL